MAPSNGYVLYDGNCGICSNLAARMRGTLERHGFALARLQDGWVAERTGIATDVLVKEFRVLTSDGEVRSAGDAYRYIFRRLPWAWPIYAVAVTPGLKQIFDATYRLVADNRHHISRACRLDAPAG